MTTTDIVTSQYVSISQTPAGLSDRFLAKFLDMFILFVYSMFFWYFSFMFVWANDWLRFITTVVWLLSVTMYDLLFEVSNNGQSPGKRLMHIRVVKTDGTQPTLGNYALRWLLLMVDMWFYAVGAIFIITTKRRQRIGDMAAGTMVIKLDAFRKLSVNLDEFAYAQPDYKPSYPQAENLSYGQADLIERTLQSSHPQRGKQLEELARKVQTTLGVTPREKYPEEFLTHFIHDYQYFLTVY